jgi:biopolymer transport protein ExbD
MRLSKKLKYKRGQKEPMDVDITSLLDILVILLVFLLQSYSASDLRVDLVENLSLPSSASQALGSRTVLVQINREEKMWVDDKYIGSITTRGEIIPELSEILKLKKAEKEQEIEKLNERVPSSNVEEKALEKRKDGLKRINLILDEEIQYALMRKLMHTSAMAGFPEFKFIVRGSAK